MYVHILCFTQIFYGHGIGTPINYIVGSCLFGGEKREENSHLFCTKHCTGVQWLWFLFILSSDTMEGCGESTCTTDLLLYLTSLMHLVSKKLKRLRRSGRLRIEFTDKYTKRKSSCKIMAELLLKH